MRDVNNLAEYLLAQAADNDPVLVSPTEGTYTYAQLKRAAAVLARHYVDHGLTGRRVGLEISPTFGAVAAYVALLAADNTVVLARHADQPPWEGYLAAADVATVIRQGAVSTNGNGAPPLTFLPPSRPAINLFTSGTTGRPKMVELSHDALMASCEAILDRVPVRPDTRMALVLSLAHSFGLSVLNTHLRQGASLYCVERVEFPGDVMRAFTEGGANAMAGVPTQLRTLTATVARSPERRLAIDTVLQAGGRLEPDDAAALVAILPPDCGLYQMYGQTEAAARISILPADAYAKVPTSVGRPILGLTVQVVDEQGAEVAAGVEGEILVQGTTIMDGYYDNPEATAAVLKDGWLHTGDIGHVDADGYLYISGRHSTFVKVDGERISLEAVEHAVMASHPSVVADALAAAVKTDRGWALTLDVVLAEGASVPADDWRAFQRELKESVRVVLGKKAVPATVGRIDSVPYTHNGKKARPNVVY